MCSLLYSWSHNWHHQLCKKFAKETIYNIVTDAVEIEKDFINKSIPCAMIGMNSELMKQYIEFVADRLIVQFGYNKKYNTNNPFPFMELLSMRQKTNFFEKRVGEYQKAGVGIENNSMNISFDDDF